MIVRNKKGQFMKGNKSGGAHKGFKHTQKTIELMRKNKIGIKNPKSKFNAIGYKHTQKWKEEARLRNLGSNNPSWKGGVSDNRHKVKSPEYKQWVSDVFSRDNWTCQTCGIRGKQLQAHHIKSWAHYPKLRFNMDNGVSLCIACHKLTDNYKGRGIKYDKYN